jgi:hypothetical protein
MEKEQKRKTSQARSYRMRQAQWRNGLAHAPRLRQNRFPIETPKKICGALDRNMDEHLRC